MATEVILSELQDTPPTGPNSPTVAFVVDANRKAQVRTNGVNLPSFIVNGSGKATGLYGPDGNPVSLGSKNRNRRILSRGLTGDVVTLASTDANFVTGVTAGGLSAAVRIGVATDFDAVRILIANYDSSTPQITSVLLASPDCSGIANSVNTGTPATYKGAGAFNGGNAPSVNGDNTRDTVFGISQGGYNNTVNGSGFVTATFDNGNSTTKTLPAKSVLGFNVPSWTATDWMSISSQPRNDGGTTPLLDVYLSWAAGSIITLSSFGSGAPTFAMLANDANYARMWRTYFAAGTVTNVNSFQSVFRVQPSTPAIIVQYRARKDSVQVLMLGDSIYEGISQTLPHNNFSIQAALALHTTALPVEILPLARISQPSTDQLNHFRQMSTFVQPTVFMAQCLSTNALNKSSELAFNLVAQSSVAAELIEMNKAGAVPLVIGLTPTTTAGFNYGTADPWRISSNALLSASVPLEGGVFVGLDPTLGTGGTSGGQLQLGAAFTADGIHLIDAGHTAAKVPVQAGLAAAIALI